MRTSIELIALAQRNLERFKSPNLLAACVTGSVAKGYADETSDIDTLLFFKEKLSQEEFDKVVADAKLTGGDLHLGNPEDGFALYYKIDGIICDFAFIYYKDTEEMFKETVGKPDATPILHLQISGIVEGIDLYGEEWLNKLRDIAANYSGQMQKEVVSQHLKFHPKWVIEKMGYERNDILFINETLLADINNMVGILCGINKLFLPGKLKSIDHTIEKMKIKPPNFMERYKNVFKLHGKEASDEIYNLIDETIALVEKHLPEVSTERAKKIRNMTFGG